MMRGRAAGFGLQMSETAPSPRTPFTFSKTGFRGVYWEASRQMFRVEIGSRNRGTLKRVGRFLTAREAAEAYDIAAMELYGADAILNFPLSGYKTVIPVSGHKTICASGHKMDEANTYVFEGQPYCRICRNAAARRYKAAKR